MRLQPTVRKRAQTAPQLWSKFVEDPDAFQDLRELKKRLAVKHGRGHPARKLPDFLHRPSGDGLWMHTADMPPQAHAALTLWDMQAPERDEQHMKVRMR